MTAYERSLFERALAAWGEGAQVIMTIQECSELITALTDVYRKSRDLDLDHIAEETADVEIMCSQMRIILGDTRVDTQKGHKLQRLRQRLDEADEDARVSKAAVQNS